MAASTITLAGRTAVPPGPPPHKDMVWIAGGTFTMGSNDHYAEEAPAHRVTVDGFWMDVYPVTNLQFGRFVKATGYVTLAERVPNAADYPGAKPEMLAPGSVVFVRPAQRVDLNDPYTWWHWVAGADWRRPEGPGSTLHGRERHPVVHVAWEDAAAYATTTPASVLACERSRCGASQREAILPGGHQSGSTLIADVRSGSASSARR